MTHLEKQVTSLELSERLKSIGVKQESHFVWYPGHGDDTQPVRYFLQSTFDSNYDSDFWPLDKAFAAFTVAELGEILPVHTKSYKVCDYPQWYCNSPASKDYEESANTEAEARGLMLEYLIKSKLLVL